jgi:energy-coupling factor transporter ATP-binding protein EcfA2
MRQWSDEDELAVEEALRLTGTAEFAHMPVESLSGGQRQRCWIAMALAQQTPYILLDEPTTFLDLRYQVEILELLHTLTRQHGRTVVVVLHDLNFAVNYGDSLVFLRQGKVRGVLHEGDCTELIKAVFDVDVHMSINPLTGKPFFMPFRQARNSHDAHLSGFPAFHLLLALGAIAHLGYRRALYRPQTVVEALSISIRAISTITSSSTALLRLWPRCDRRRARRGRAAAVRDPQPARRAAYSGAQRRGGAGGGDERAWAVAAVWSPADCRRRRRAVSAGADVLLAGRTGLTPMKVTLCGVAVGVCLVDYRGVPR